MVERVIERDRRLTGGMTEEDIATLRRITQDMFRKAEEMMEEERQLGSPPTA